MNLPTKPMLNEAELVRCERPYTGPVEPGDVFAWEPDLAYARMLVVVTKISLAPSPIEINHASGTALISQGEGNVIWTKDLANTKKDAVWNSEGRFREAVIPTRFKRMRP